MLQAKINHFLLCKNIFVLVYFCKQNFRAIVNTLAGNRDRLRKYQPVENQNKLLLLTFKYLIFAVCSFKGENEAGEKNDYK